MSYENIPYEQVEHCQHTLTEEETRQRERFKRFLDNLKVRATDHCVFPPEILMVDEITIATVGNFSASVGKPKSKKTFNVSAIVAALLSGKEVLHYRAKLPQGKTKVLYVDTEQSRVHCLKVLHRILKLADLPTDKEASSIDFLMLREFTPFHRRNIINSALECDNAIGFMVIDGIRDLVGDINSPGESLDIINDLLRWTSQYNIHIHTVLHLNKSDDNTRGHIGTELNNKAETVIKVVKNDANPDVSEVRPMITREKEFEPFAFCINKDGPPENSEISHNSQKVRMTLERIPMEAHKEALDAVFAAGSFKGHSLLMERLKESYAKIDFERGRTTYVNLYKMMKAAGVIVLSDKEYSYHPDNLSKLKGKEVRT